LNKVELGFLVCPNNSHQEDMSTPRWALPWCLHHSCPWHLYCASAWWDKHCRDCKTGCRSSGPTRWLSRPPPQRTRVRVANRTWQILTRR